MFSNVFSPGGKYLRKSSNLIAFSLDIYYTFCYNVWYKGMKYSRQGFEHAKAHAEAIFIRKSGRDVKCPISLKM